MYRLSILHIYDKLQTIYLTKEDVDMTLLGILLLLVGAGLAVYGYSLNNSVEAQLESLFTNGSTNPGTIFIIVGIIVAVLGIVFIIKKKRK